MSEHADPESFYHEYDVAERDRIAELRADPARISRSTCWRSGTRRTGSSVAERRHDLPIADDAAAVGSVRTPYPPTTSPCPAAGRAEPPVRSRGVHS
ncbi:hypothetical protein B4589_012075 [Halolamina sp. CBA1230]|uniref:hypothetical protein n=1 Tax=Halolamina sp. CBA1230 TaxID=1853690 RepID=UPI00117B7C12|nr:hypothetical protein [Halolamina sp. CBA1230]QKY21074.1 hypothetical protein B4589_012075 [Halolamina sp. CBA1230]